jgi:hypothetical protein
MAVPATCRCCCRCRCRCHCRCRCIAAVAAAPTIIRACISRHIAAPLQRLDWTVALFVIVLALDLEHAPPGSTPTRSQLPSLPGRAHDVVPAAVQVPVHVYPSQNSTPKPHQESVSCLPALPTRCTQATDQPPPFPRPPNLPNKLPSSYLITAMAPLPPTTCPPHLTSLAATLALLHTRLHIYNLIPIPSPCHP